MVGDRYVVHHELGRGGFATVYLATQRATGQKVAIKVLHSTDPMFVERFEREARAAAGLAHPHVLKVHDLGVAPSGERYLVLEFLNGKPLDVVLAETVFEPEHAVHLMCGALDGLRVAHENGIVHRDLKPSNLFLDRPGERAEMLKVLDFGIAYIEPSEDEQRMTSTGHWLGTPQYLPPEYVLEHVVGPTIDVYQAGLILAEMLLGFPLVDEDNAVRCALRHKEGVELPGELLETPLGREIQRAISRDYNERHADAGELLAALEALEFEDLPTVETTEMWRKRVVAERRTRDLGPAAFADTATLEGATNQLVARAKPQTTVQQPTKRHPWSLPLVFAIAMAVGATGWFATRPSSPPEEIAPIEPEVVPLPPSANEPLMAPVEGIELDAAEDPEDMGNLEDVTPSEMARPTKKAGPVQEPKKKRHNRVLLP